MEIEERIGKLERISVRVVAMMLLLLALLALLLFGGFHFAKFMQYLWRSW